MEQIPPQDQPPDPRSQILSMLTEIHTLMQTLVAVEQTRGAGVRESVIRFVNDRPGFFSSSVIADQLCGRIHTKSPDPRRVIMTTIAALVREGALERDALGRVIPAEAKEIAHETEHSSASP